MIPRSAVSPEILSKPCGACKKKLPESEDGVLTYFRGEFVMLHERCAERFIRQETVRESPE